MRAGCGLWIGCLLFIGRHGIELCQRFDCLFGFCSRFKLFCRL